VVSGGPDNFPERPVGDRAVGSRADNRRRSIVVILYRVCKWFHSTPQAGRWHRANCLRSNELGARLYGLKIAPCVLIV